MSAWSVFARTLYEVLRVGTLSSVRAIDEGGFATLNSDACVIIAANHVSHADTSVLYWELPQPCRARARFVASGSRFSLAKPSAPLRERFERWLLHGLAVNAYHAILVGGDVHGLQSIEQISLALRDGSVVAMYPEGTRSKTGVLRPLKPGVAMVACATKCIVVPVRIDGTREALPKSMKFPRFRSRISVRFRAPLVAETGETHANFLARLTHALQPCATGADA